MKSCLHFIILTFCYSSCLFSQTSGSIPYNEFDKVSGQKNSGLSNGKLHINSYRSADKTHRYYNTEQYLTGNIFYDGQPYYDVAVKYDLLKDELVVKMDGNNTMGFNLISEKLTSFFIDNKKFVNLSLVKHPDFINGFYEETAFDGMALYTKYHKERKEVLTGEVILNTYYPEYDFVVAYKNSWHEINSQKDVTEIFPEYAGNIADYYQMNASLERSDRKQFLKNLFGYINGLLHKNQ